MTLLMITASGVVGDKAFTKGKRVCSSIKTLSLALVLIASLFFLSSSFVLAQEAPETFEDVDYHEQIQTTQTLQKTTPPVEIQATPQTEIVEHALVFAIEKQTLQD